ncbi:MAG: TIR domain-containing protein [Myxococcota bacterium]
MPRTIHKRCICGRSNQFPLCDGQHGTLNWKCSPSSAQFHDRVIIGSSHYRSLTEEMAHRHQLVTHHTHPGVTHCDELIIIHDPDDITPLLGKIERIEHSRRRIISIDCLPSAILIRHPKTMGFQVNSNPLTELRVQVDQLLNACKSQAKQLPESIFISHSIADEMDLKPCINRLRSQYQNHPFVCEDSIAAGHNWNQEIEQALRRSSVVLAFCSSAYQKSTYCAFEIGFAQALKIPIRPILIDDTYPPSHLQHLNAPSVQRIHRNNPWYTKTDAMMAAIFRALKDLLVQNH